MCMQLNYFAWKRNHYGRFGGQFNGLVIWLVLNLLWQFLLWTKSSSTLLWKRPIGMEGSGLLDKVPPPRGPWMERDSPAVLVEGENVALVFYAGHAAVVLVLRGEDLVWHVLWFATLLRVLRPVVPQQRQHHLSCKQQDVILATRLARLSDYFKWKFHFCVRKEFRCTIIFSSPIKSEGVYFQKT